MVTQGELIPFAREVIDVPVDNELGESFLAYSLSVITSRAIPDVRDGLKPVQRRILYSMQEMGLRPERPHRKCAHVVGDVMAKYHPHGDSAIYDTLVRLGQDFSRPVTLIDPQGNFGSLDDPPAAYRYTECRLTPAALDLLSEIGEETVEWRATYDGETEEPAYLPGLLPNLLVNGTSGIAVGMATNMAPHNLREVYEAIKLFMTKRRPRPTIDELLEVIPGPDFPSGGIVIDTGIRDAYETGRGTVRIRAKAEIVAVTRARKAVEITELPYLVGPERVISKIKELVNKGRLDGISDVTNLTDRKLGLRLVIEFKTGVDPKAMLEKLYRLTPLEETFGINNVVLVEGVPTTVGLYDLCHHYVEHRLDVVVRRTQFRLRKAEERLHIVEGLLIAIDHIDEVVAIIRSSSNTEEARSRLMERLELSRTQADFVLELRLRRLTALAYDELTEEKTELITTIAKLQKILGSEQRQRTIVLNELARVVEDYGTERTTRIVSEEDLPTLQQIEIGSSVAEEPDSACVITLSATGVVGREPQGSSKSYTPSRHDVLHAAVTTSLRQPVLAITAKGKLFIATARDLAEVGGRSRGKPAIESFGADRGDDVITVMPTTGQPLVFVTASGRLKRIERDVLANLRSGRVIMGLDGNDRIVAINEVDPSATVVLVSSDGQVLRTPVEAVSIQGPTAKGVAGMSLKGNAKVIGAGAADDSDLVVAISDLGTTKATSVAEIPIKGRGTAGVRLARFKDEGRIDFAWVGDATRAMCVVAQPDSATKADNTPAPLTLRPTRRDGPFSASPTRILGVGPLRW